MSPCSWAVPEIASQHHELIFQQNIYLCHPERSAATPFPNRYPRARSRRTPRIFLLFILHQGVLTIIASQHHELIFRKNIYLCHPERSAATPFSNRGPRARSRRTPRIFLLFILHQGVLAIPHVLLGTIHHQGFLKLSFALR